MKKRLLILKHLAIPTQEDQEIVAETRTTVAIKVIKAKQAIIPVTMVDVGVVDTDVVDNTMVIEVVILAGETDQPRSENTCLYIINDIFYLETVIAEL